MIDQTMFNFDEEPLRTRVLNLAAMARDAMTPAELAARSGNELRLVVEDGDLVARYGGIKLLTLDEDMLRHLRDADEADVVLTQLPAVPDDPGALVDGRDE